MVWEMHKSFVRLSCPKQVYPGQQHVMQCPTTRSIAYWTHADYDRPVAAVEVLLNSLGFATTSLDLDGYSEGQLQCFAGNTIVVPVIMAIQMVVIMNTSFRRVTGWSCRRSAFEEYGRSVYTWFARDGLQRARQKTMVVVNTTICGRRCCSGRANRKSQLWQGQARQFFVNRQLVSGI